MPILFSLLQLQTSCSFGTFPKAAHRVAIGANRRIVIAKPKLEPIMTKSLGVAEDFGPERGQPRRANLGLQQVLPMGIELSILRPGLVNQSQE